MSVVYKITRCDGLEYIGITGDLRRRLRDHEKSDRFSVHGIQNVVILFEGSYEECVLKEPEYIQLYDTFYSGLNCTINGKGKSGCESFNTLGFVFSAESRKKMSESAKRRGVSRVGFKHSEETKKAWSAKRRGVYNGARLIDPDEALRAYADFVVTVDHIIKYCKKNMKSGVVDNDPCKYIGPNGKPLSKKIIFCKEYSTKVGVTKEGISACLSKHGI